MAETGPMYDQEVLDELRQVKMRRSIQLSGTQAWTTVYKDWSENDDIGRRTGAEFAIFSDPQDRPERLRHTGWDATIGQGQPGFSKSYPDGVETVTYHRNSLSDGGSPLVIVQEMHGVVANRLLIAEEFQLLLNLWEDRKTGNFLQVLDDGSSESAIEISADEVRVRTPLLRRFQAALQLDLILMTDSIRYVNELDPDGDYSFLVEGPTVVDGGTVLELYAGEVSRKVFSRLLAKKILAPPPREKSGVWPWEVVDTHFPEFIIGEDGDGQVVLSTCDPDRLRNFFGANPDAAPYLTPVHFRKTVLQRYYNDPSLYTVSDGRLACAGLWSIQIDNHLEDVVGAFLGDLGRDLPRSHRDHWRAHNIPPVKSMSETTLRRSLLAQFAESTNPEHIFRNAYKRLNRDWETRVGWPLFREPRDSDAHLIDTVHIPLDETDQEFESQILNLCKITVDLLNEKKLTMNLDPVDDEKGISKLERYLKSVSYEHVERDVQFLRKLQALRSRLSAHGKGSDAAKFRNAALDDGTRSAAVARLMESFTRMADGLLQLAEAIASGGTNESTRSPRE